MTPIEEGSLEIQPPQAARKKQDKVKERIQQDKDAVVATMSVREGRRTIYRLLITTQFFGTSYTGNSDTNFNEGKRYIGRLLYEELQDLCPVLYTTMVNENRPTKEDRNA